MTQNQPLRLFFALPLADDLYPLAVQVQQRIARSGAKVKWVEARNLHFTLKFLGEMPFETINKLAETAQQIAQQYKPFELEIVGGGAFPRPADARTIWLGCIRGQDTLCALAQDLDKALSEAKLALPEPRPFKAHLTIGRNKDRIAIQELARTIEAEKQTVIGTQQVKSFILMQSVLNRTGPVYTPLHEFTLQPETQN